MSYFQAVNNQTVKRNRHVVVGRVQGVGFRPFVYRLALERGLAGFVLNSPEGVVIEVQGPAPALEGFTHDLLNKLPPLAMIVEHSVAEAPVVSGEEAFRIERSSAGEGHHVLVSPDVATCEDCLADMSDPDNRRHNYAFTNCTNCGPRYTITRSLPYDRATTSMACFPLCPDCAKEYEDPLDRRFHAQPNACPVCGPLIWLADRKGKRQAEGHAAIEKAAKALAKGKILAMKGLGGFHLAADACDPAAVALLRARKHRPGKPLAVMVPDLDDLRALASPSPEECELLLSKERPIVLVPIRSDGPLAPDVSPDTDLLGAMLPYTPQHHLLLRAFRKVTGRPAALVMTSGNMSSEPISLGNREALSRLKAIADVFLLHNRDILVRTDDSVLRLLPAAEGGFERQFLRRARGFTPSPVFLPRKGPSVLGVGPELKNTVCLTKENQAFVSQHIGDMHNMETAAFHKEVIAHLESILQVKPEAVVADLHPDYLSTRYALEESGLPVLRLQHHFAHVFAGLAEHRLEEPVLGIALDGSGYGGDGTIWGGEFLYVDPVNMVMERVGRFQQVPLPGGEAAIRQPWRMAAAYLDALGLAPDPAVHPWLRGREQALATLRAMIAKGVNSPLTSSCGRLFDAVAGLMGLCQEISYEGQAAIRLEHAQDMAEARPYGCGRLERDGMLELATLELFGQASEDFAKCERPAVISRRFHLGLAHGLAAMAGELRKRTDAVPVVISGGVFCNASLTVALSMLLSKMGIKCAAMNQTHPGDGCISLGQAYYGSLLVQK
ncbi:carbamoyltransferase HypF [Fundidesulfovibrio soli]|uniref:carbamoyltransferase HypF n=1 Tax=Fundidesulfovibrio soli TaxID=2922716 RepID=UPI001FAEF6B9|nr:carbamoyltransferase HypF [Fundidesulfovibrio soli]